MSTTITQTAPSVQKLELTTAYGPVYRDVSTAPPRDATPEEIPIIDISGLYGDAEARLRLSGEIKKAAMTNGFFYIKNHGIDDTVIEESDTGQLEVLRSAQRGKDSGIQVRVQVLQWLVCRCILTSQPHRVTRCV